MASLTDIRTKVRRLTGLTAESDITDTQIDNYVNTFYLYDIPQQLKLFDLHTTFEFITTPNVDTYDLTSMTVEIGPTSTTAAQAYYQLQNPSYCGGYLANLMQDRTSFYALYPQFNQQEAVQGDGTPGAYTLTLSRAPLLQESLSIGAIDDTGVQVDIVDDPINRETGNLKIINSSTSVVGSINYLTGALSVTFANNIPTTSEINIGYCVYATGRPLTFLYYDNKLILRPVPDNAYLISIQAYTVPTILASAATSPLIEQWWQYLAYGAAKKIFEDSQDPDSLASLMPGFREQQTYVQRKTIVQNAQRRTPTVYSEQQNYAQGSWPAVWF